MQIKKYLVTTLAIVSLLSIRVPAQQTNPTVVKTVVVTAQVKECELGQPVQLSVVAKDASGNIVNEKPSTYFAGPTQRMHSAVNRNQVSKGQQRIRTASEATD